MNKLDTLFTNDQIDLNGLPEADSMDMIPLEPVYKKERFISAVLTAIVLIFSSWLIAWLELQPGLYGYIGAGFITLISVWMIYYTILSFRYMRYALREKDISYASGWLWKSITTVPFNRVQHCEIKQSVIDRYYGLSKLTIYTAGGQSTDLVIPGLLPETAEKLKSYILGSTELTIGNE